jgi:hypothetical protein
MRKKFMVGQIFEELVEEKGEAYTMDGKRCSKPFSPNLKLWCVMDSKCSYCQVETIKVVMVWCARCESKDSITSQA